MVSSFNDNTNKRHRMIKRIYISGKITGIEGEAAAIFEKAEAEVLKLGFEPVNPMKINHDHDLSWQSYMKADIKALMNCDGIYLINNWKESKGARIEHRIANRLGMEIYSQGCMEG